MEIPKLIGVESETTAPSPAATDGDVQTWHEHGQVCAYGYAAGGADWLDVPEIATYRLGSEVLAFAHTSTPQASIVQAQGQGDES